MTDRYAGPRRTQIKLTIFSDRRYLPENVPPFVMLYPFWGQATDDLAVVNRAIYDRYLATGRDFFELTALDHAHAAVLPFAWEYAAQRPDAQTLADRLAAEAARFNKPVLVFYRADYESPLPVPNSLIFRTSLTRDRRRPNEFILPGWTTDFADQYCAGQVRVRPKGLRPVVGFCGDVSSGKRRRDRLGRLLGANPAIWRFARRLGIELIPHPGSRIRLHALRALARSPSIQPNFVIRYGHWNGAVYRGAVLDRRKVEQSRQDYVENMLGSDYILCARGKGNYSYRLYETLSCGRIPVFVNTNGVLPYEHWIDWRQYCVWVDEQDLAHIAERVAEFHERLSPRQFEDLQLACRQLWLDWLSPAGFFANFYRHFT